MGLRIRVFLYYCSLIHKGVHNAEVPQADGKTKWVEE